MNNAVPSHPTPSNSQGKTTEAITGWLKTRGSEWYGGEAVTQLEHALQCATLARADGAPSTLVIAALLHDIGHLTGINDDRQHPHDKLGAELLKDVFPLSVTEPICLHVNAKRYLCATDPFYWSGLSRASRQSLEWQGGPFPPKEAAEFIRQPYAEDAVRLRRWDDNAKIPGAATGELDEFLGLMQAVLIDDGKRP